MSIDNFRSQQCLDISRNGMIVSLIRLQTARKEIDSVSHRLEQAMEGLKYLVSDLYNPTGGQVRMDTEGSGVFGASRGVRLHLGVDLQCIPGQKVMAPHSGRITRMVYPYANNLVYKGVEIVNDTFISWLFYIEPLHDLIGKQVVGGQVVGVAQNITQKYSPKMKPHIHWTLYVNPEMFITHTLEN